MLRKNHLFVISIAILFIVSACGGNSSSSDDGPPTETLVGIVSLTPRTSATPFSTRTPLPTFTWTPSVTPTLPPPSDTPVPTSTPIIVGIVASAQRVNVREGPGTTFAEFEALVPGTGVTVLGQNSEGTWYEIELEDGRRGWIAASLVRLESTATPFPTLTPSPDLTALALGTPLPTALFGDGTVTPTPPPAAITATPPSVNSSEEATQGDASGTTATEPFLPIRDPDSIYETATALAGGISIQTPIPDVNSTATPVGQSPNSQATPDPQNPVTVTPTSRSTTASTGTGVIQEGVDVFASCNDRSAGLPAPTNIGVGSTVDVFWAWFMSSPDFIDQHLNAVSYEVRVNGQLLRNWRQYGLGTRQQGSSFVKYWFVPFGPLEAGEYTITYRATWSQQITDGWEFFGPGSSNPIEEGSCTFTVR